MRKARTIKETDVQKLSTNQVARALQISRDTVVRLIESGELPCERLTPTSPRRILEKDIIQYAQRNNLTLILPSPNEK